MKGINLILILGILFNFFSCKEDEGSKRPKAEKINLSSEHFELQLGETKTLTAKVEPKEAVQTVSYQSNDEKVATVTQEGEVKAVAEGDAKITVSSKSEPGVSAICKVSVKNTQTKESSTTSSGLVEIPDDNFRAYLKEHIPDAFPDGGGKMDVNSDAVKNREELAIFSKEIQSLQGVEYFTGLTNLNCSGNKLTTLDVSKNKALSKLNCKNNVLNNLKIGANDHLTYLNCSTNKLTTLDVSKNTALSTLQCQDNQFTVLDLTNNCNFSISSSADELNVDEGVTITYCKKLVEIPDANFRAYLKQEIPQAFPEGGDKMDANSDAVKNLRKIDPLHDEFGMIIDDKYIKSFKGIEYFIELEKLNCDSHKITTLDLSKNTKLTELSCINVQTLVELNITKNTKLNNLDCYYNLKLEVLNVSKNIALTELNCSYNKLTTLDVTHNTKLTDLVCNNNNLTTLDVTHNIKLTYLVCNNNKLTSLDLSNNCAEDLEDNVTADEGVTITYCQK